MWEAAAVGFDGLLERYRWQFGTDDPALLDWTGTMRVRPRITSDPVLDARPDAPRRNTVIFGPPGDRLPNPDASVDVVVIEDPARLGEARRVARDAVFVWPRDANPAPEWLRPAPVAAPEVSVVVPTATGDVAGCLRAIADVTARVNAIELIVADASPGFAAAAPAAAHGARHAPADPERGAVNAVVLGAEAARGGVLVLVGERVRVRPGWLRPLVRALRADPDAGVVAGRLLTPDGTVARAGGALRTDGSTGAPGAGADLYDPAFAAAGEAAFAPLPLLATRRGLFVRLGGVDGLLDEEHAAADYALVRASRGCASSWRRRARRDRRGARPCGAGRALRRPLGRRAPAFSARG